MTKELELKVVTPTNTSKTSVHSEKITCLDKYSGSGKIESMVVENEAQLCIRKHNNYANT